MNQNVGDEVKDYTLEKRDGYYSVTFIATGNEYAVWENGTVQDVQIIPMKMEGKEEENKKYYYVAKIKLTTGGNYGYSFRVMPQNEMILDSENMDLVKWIEK